MNDVEKAALAIELKGVTRRYGPRFALRGLDLRVAQGEVLAVLGPNGAGKTTLIRVLSQLVQPSSGDVRVLGRCLSEDAAWIRRQVGVISHDPFVDPNLTGRENLEFYGRLFRVEPLRERIERTLEAVRLLSRADTRVGTWSKGMTQRLAIARAILHQPRIILLDEPFTGLDPLAAERFADLLRALRGPERAFLMATHHLEQAIALSDRVVIQIHGRIAIDLSLAGLSVDELRRYYVETLRKAEHQPPMKGDGDVE